MNVFILNCCYYPRQDSDCVPHTDLVGVYSSLEKAHQAAEESAKKKTNPFTWESAHRYREQRTRVNSKGMTVNADSEWEYEIQEKEVQ